MSDLYIKTWAADDKGLTVTVGARLFQMKETVHRCMDKATKDWHWTYNSASTLALSEPLSAKLNELVLGDSRTRYFAHLYGITAPGDPSSIQSSLEKVLDDAS